MAETFQVIAFGDLTVPYYAELRQLLSKKTDAVLVSLFADTYHLLKAEFGALPPSQRAVIPPSSNLSELLEAHHASDNQSCALRGALACLSQLASFVS